MKKSKKYDKILSTPSTTGSTGTSESSNTTIDSGHVGASNKSFFLDFSDEKDTPVAQKTMDLRPDRKDDGKIL
jgi:hypothetical protein